MYWGCSGRGRSGQDGRPRALAAGPVRDPSIDGDQGRRRRLAAIGDPNAAVPTPQPVVPRLGFNCHSPSAASTSVAFVASAAIEDQLAESLAGVRPRMVPVENVRGRTKEDLPETRRWRPSRLTPIPTASASTVNSSKHQPAVELLMAQRYFLFLWALSRIQQLPKAAAGDRRRCCCSPTDASLPEATRTPEPLKQSPSSEGLNDVPSMQQFLLSRLPTFGVDAAAGSPLLPSSRQA